MPTGCLYSLYFIATSINASLKRAWNVDRHDFPMRNPTTTAQQKRPRWTDDRIDILSSVHLSHWFYSFSFHSAVYVPAKPVIISHQIEEP
jgi:hypothetical protein